MKRCLRCDLQFDADAWGCPACAFTPGRVLGNVPAFALDSTRDEAGYDPSRFEVLFQVEKEHFWFRSRAKLISWALRTHFPLARNMLEIGCGTGGLLAWLVKAFPTIAFTGAEAHLSGLSLASRHVEGASFIQMDARHVPYRNEFDVVGAFDVIEHIEEDQDVLKEMFATGRPGGGILITVPQHRWLWSYRDVSARHRRRYDRRQLRQKIRAAGFERVWTTSFVSLLLPLMMGSRFQQKTKRGFEESGELGVGRRMNSVLEGVMSVERSLIALGLAFPVGGSLLAVAYKPHRV